MLKLLYAEIFSDYEIWVSTLQHQQKVVLQKLSIAKSINLKVLNIH